MSGADLRLGRLFDRESGRAFITAYDHGTTLKMPPEPGGVRATVGNIVAGEPDGVLVSPGTLKQTEDLFAHRGAPVPIVRTDWTVLDERMKDVGERHRVLIEPEEAQRLGAGAIVVYLIQGPESGGMFADNVRSVARAGAEAQRLGLPFIVEATLWGSRIEEKKDPDLLAYGCRIASELGADAVKTEYTGDVGSMRDVIAACPVPVLTLGGARSGDERDVIASATGAIEAGARGIIFGRNVWMSGDPVGMSRRLREAVHGKASVGRR
ncbi:class I fructose-bisphosphate aldolase [Rubrobacter indicoceani]|uniref:class I fructose-bisphosphate aldolase n=1 Tax=Rubrobacter indicoceani TaxID=2051957 RepID=UPI000E5BEFEA|nr:fructose-bisphosphate aldolase [Rubrobacter indicoceani]